MIYLYAMKVFLDTNIILEYLEQRREYEAVGRIFSAIEDNRLKAVVSVGCVYTLAYLIRMELKRKYIHRPEQTALLRSTLNTILSLVSVVGVSYKHIIEGVNDSSFEDVEDSFQYKSALQAKCDVFITINLRDYHATDMSRMSILSPTEFVNRYL
mgnify:CR=1 FL=1